jgi:hypothetical protein
MADFTSKIDLKNCREIDQKCGNLWHAYFLPIRPNYKASLPALRNFLIDLGQMVAKPLNRRFWNTPSSHSLTAASTALRSCSSSDKVHQ